MLIWLIVQSLASILCVVLPYAMQARESLHPPMNTPSLGTFGIIMMAGFFFAAAGLVNGLIAGGRLEWPWFGSAALALCAAALGVVSSYAVLYAMAAKGGAGLTVLGGIVLMLLLTANLGGPWFL